MPKSSRRQFLTLLGVLPLAALVPGRIGFSAGIQTRKGTYSAEVGLLYDSITFRLSGTLDETVDRDAGRYDVRAVGEGDGIANRLDSSGRFRDGRWIPDRANSWFLVRGRESRTDIVYDWATRRISYKFRGETFFLRRIRVVEDTVTVPEGLRVDDAMSSLLNHAEGLWPRDADGQHRTHIVRRRRKESEGPDDVDPNARAELVPFELKVDREKDTGKPLATFDMTRFSSWARRDRPARIVFSANRRPELIATSLMLGTSVTIRFRDV